MLDTVVESWKESLRGPYVAMPRRDGSTIEFDICIVTASRVEVRFVAPILRSC